MAEQTMREDFQVGEQASYSRTVTADDVRAVAEVSGDHNPLHLDEEYGRKTRFGRCIVHGVYSAGLISAVLGTRLPGPGSVYLSQKLSFLAPVFVGDTITATAEVLSWRPDKKIITLRSDCYNQQGQKVVAGEAVLMMIGLAMGGK